MPTHHASPARAFAVACRATGPIRLRATHRTTGHEQTHVVNAPFAVVGRAAGAGVRLDDPSVSQCHAYLQTLDGVLYCVDLGSRAGVEWEDGTRGRGWLRPGDVARVGAFDVRVDDDGGPAEAVGEASDGMGYPLDPPLTPAAVEVYPAVAGGVHPLDRPLALVGRHPTCDLRLLTDGIGYFQCALVNTADGVWLVDPMTPKGTVVNGRPARLTRLGDGDLIEAGKVSLVLRLGAGDHRSANGLAVRNVPATVDPVAAISTTVAESLAPVGEMVKQFQQCFVTMAEMFTSMQQQHSALVCEQMKQIQELATELRELRAEVRRGRTGESTSAAPPPPAPAPLPAAQPAPAPPRPAAHPTPAGPENQILTDAHSWFADRLAGKGQSPPPG